MPDSSVSPNPDVLRVANATATLGVAGYGGVAFQIQGTWAGTITFEASVQGSEFVPLRVVETDNSTPVTTTTSGGIFVGSAVGLTVVRARMSSYSSGGASVLIRADVASPGGSGGGGGSGTDVNLIEVGGASIALGQAAMAASLPVVIASDQTPIPITGSISATNPSVSATGSAVPADATYIGILDPTGNLEGFASETFDYDTGAGTKLVTAPGVSIPASGGPLAVLGGHGTAAQALRVELPTDGTGVIAGVGTVTTVSSVTAIANALPAGSNSIGAVTNVPLTNFGAGEYETVAASQTAQVLGATGAAGDFLMGLLVVPATTSPGNVLLLDNATSITVFVGGASSVSNLVPFLIPLGMFSVSGAWKVTTGTNVSVIGIGNFT